MPFSTSPGKCISGYLLIFPGRFTHKVHNAPRHQSHRHHRRRPQLGFRTRRTGTTPETLTLVGYLVAGICVGPFTPGFVADQQIANQLSELGVMLLMFGVGLHFSLEDLLEVKAIAIPGALVQIAAATLLGWGLAWTMGWPMVQGVVFGLALSVASTVVLLRALEERRLIDTQRGRIAVGWLIVEDLVMVLALVLLPALAQMLNGNESVAGHTQNADSDSNAMLTALGWTLLKMTGFVAVMLVVGRRVIPWSLEKVAATGSRELFTLAVLGIALGVAFGSAKLFGVSFALGAFFAGMVLKAQRQVTLQLPIHCHCGMPSQYCSLWLSACCSIQQS